MRPTRGHDHAFGIRAGDLEAVEEALVAHRLRPLAVDPADEVVGRAGRRDPPSVFTPFSPSATRIGVVMPSISFSSSATPSSLPARVLLRLDAGKIVLRAISGFPGAVSLVEALDRDELGRCST